MRLARLAAITFRFRRSGDCRHLLEAKRLCLQQPPLAKRTLARWSRSFFLHAPGDLPAPLPRIGRTFAPPTAADQFDRLSHV